MKIFSFGTLRNHITSIIKQRYKNLNIKRDIMSSPRIKVLQGELEGRVAVSHGGIDYFCFQGIPYAKPPIGDMRFKDPLPADGWSGVLQATSHAQMCPQISHDGTGTVIGNEDCLYLNVYTPKDIPTNAKLPVMVWIHGGAFIHGSGNKEAYGPDFVMDQNVILVTINYRLSVLGFLCLDTPDIPGNAGLKDQVLSLQWIHNNIHNFGGNSNNVTLFGESAGAASTMYLILSPMTRGLIHRAIIQSGSALCHWAQQTNSFQNAIKLAKYLGCPSSNKVEVLTFLRKVSTNDILKGALASLSTHEMKRCYTCPFLPVIENKFAGVTSIISESPENIITSKNYESIPMIIGFTSKESIILFERIKHDINRVNEMFEDLQYCIPPDMNLTWNSEKSLETASKIKEFYFKDRPIDNTTAEIAVDLLSDYTFIRALENTVDLLIGSTSAPVYYFKFSYLGNLNFHKEGLKKMNLSEAGHSDENNYIFKKDRHANIDVTASDELTRNRLIQMWTDFAKHGHPTPSVSDNIKTIWEPVSADVKKCMDINKEIKIIIDPNASSMNFWKTLNSDIKKV